MTHARLALCMLAIFLAAAPAGAELQRYKLHRTRVNNGNSASPNPDLSPRCLSNDPLTTVTVETCEGRAVIDATGPAPVLRRLGFHTDVTFTVYIPALGVDFFLSFNHRERAMQLATGTGASAAGSTLRWGVVSGWTLTGSTWCDSTPAVICTLAGAMDEATADPGSSSSFYDLGTWSFHGTGFTSASFIRSSYSSTYGNESIVYRGAIENAPTVTSVPVLGVGALAALLIGGAASVLRRGPARER